MHRRLIFDENWKELCICVNCFRRRDRPSKATPEEIALHHQHSAEEEDVTFTGNSFKSFVIYKNMHAPPVEETSESQPENNYCSLSLAYSVPSFGPQLSKKDRTYQASLQTRVFSILMPGFFPVH